MPSRHSAVGFLFNYGAYVRCRQAGWVYVGGRMSVTCLSLPSRKIDRANASSATSFVFVFSLLYWSLPVQCLFSHSQPSSRYVSTWDGGPSRPARLIILQTHNGTAAAAAGLMINCSDDGEACLVRVSSYFPPSSLPRLLILLFFSKQ